MDQPKRVDRLAKRLEREKVVVVKVEDSDHPNTPARMVLSIPWDGDLEVLWHRRWWPDGILQEDDHVSLKVGDQEEKIVDIQELFDKKFEKPLVEVIIDRIAEAVRRQVRGPAKVEPAAEEQRSGPAQNDELT